MTDVLEEALAALRAAPEERSGEATLERIRRSLAASEDASLRALETALTPVADVAVLYGEDDRLLDLAVAALRAPEGAEADGAATLERIRGSLGAREGEGLFDLAAAEWREETATARLEPLRDAGAQPVTRVLATLDARRARARWALAAAAALALAIVPPTAWAWSTGRIERWIASIAAPSTIEQSSAPSRSEVQAPPPRARAPRVPPAEERDAPAQEASVIVASAEDRSAASAEDRSADGERAPPAPRRPARRGGASVVASAEPRHDAPPEAHRADPPVVTEPALPSPEASTPSPAGAEERETFARAHHLHFGGAPEIAVLAAWDDYLSAYPRGHYAPEARYNRALTLVRLGRVEDARRVLARFAAAPAGAYRREEARALLEAIAANGAAAPGATAE